MFRSFCLITALLFAPAAFSETYRYAREAQGKPLPGPQNCPYTKRIVQDPTMPTPATGQIGIVPWSAAVIRYNQKMLYERFKCYALCTEWIVSGHECAHVSGILKEEQADCEGAHLLMKAGRWTQEMENEVLTAMRATFPKTLVHPAGPLRAKLLEECIERLKRAGTR